MRSALVIGGGKEMPEVGALGDAAVCANRDDGLRATQPAVAAIPRKARLPVNIAGSPGLSHL